MALTEPQTQRKRRKSAYPLLPAISDPDQYQGEAEVAVAFPDDSSAKRKLVKAWAVALPTFSSLRSVAFRSYVSHELFDAACRVPKLEYLWVKITGATNLEAAANRASLRQLHLLDAAKLESLKPLSAMTALTALTLLDFKKIDDISVIAELTNLEHLQIGGGMYSIQRVKTLAPLARLKKLKSLTLVGIRTKDDTLRPLYALTKLETFNAGTRWNADEIAEIHRRNPAIAD